MSYTDTSSEEIFPGDNSTTAWAYTQNTAAEANVKVSILDSDGVPTALTNGTHFDLAGVGGTGGITVTYPKASSPPSPYDVVLTASEKIVIWVEPPADQQFGPENTDTYAPSVIGQKFDEQMRVIQKVKKDVSRSYHVDLGADAPAAGAVGTVSSSRVLLASDTQTGAANLSVSSLNWPATYDSVELRFIGVVPVNALQHMLIEPIDNGSAVSTNLRSQNHVVQGGTNYAQANNTTWSNNTTHEQTNGADDHLNGSAIFTYYASGLVSGIGQYVYENASSLRGSTVYYRRHTTLFTRLDGFEVTMDVGNITGELQLWGIPNS